MVLELYINNKLADIGEDTDISLTKEFQDHDELERKKVEYSYELELPITFTNQKIFGFANDMQVKHKFYQTYDAQLYADSILVIDGKFMLTEVSKTAFTGNIYVPSTKELADVLGDKKLTEIDPYYINVSTFDQLSELNMEAVPKGRPTTVGDKYVCFPYVVYNFPRSKFDTGQEDEHVQFTDYENTTFTYKNIYPAYRVVKVIEQLFKTYGYKVSGNIFNDKRFSNLWMNSSFETDDYESEFNYPQFVTVVGRYDNLTSDSDTLSYIEESVPNTELKRKYYTDDIFHSSATTMWASKNDYEIYQASSTNSNNGSIVIKKSGWYQINVNSMTTLTQKNTITDKISSTDHNKWDAVQQEIRLVKGNARENTKWFSQFGQSPICPRNNDINNAAECTNFMLQNTKFYGWTKPDVDGYTRIPVNGGTAIVHDYSNFDTSNFICGVRYGQFGYSSYWLKYFYDYAPQWIMTRLPTAGPTNGMIFRANSDTEQYMVLPVVKMNADDDTVGTNFNQRDQTAVCLMSENAICYNNGYADFIAMIGSEQYDLVWWNYGNGATSPPNIGTNTAKTNTGLTPQYGRCDLNCVYYLEEGDTINLEMLITADTSYESSLFDYERDPRCPSVYMDYNITLALLSTKKDWKASSDTPIPKNIDTLKEAQSTNMNLFLPDMTCNDFIESFLTTFNCHITRISDTEYSINYSDLRDTTLNTISLEKYFDPTKVTEQSIDFPSEYNFKFTIDEDEEGYTSGDDSPFNLSTNKQDYEKPKYDGSMKITNKVNTSDDTEDTESKFSYNWYKTFWFTPKSTYNGWRGSTDYDVAKRGGMVMKAPVIADASTWDKTVAKGQEDSDKTSGTVRMFYLSDTLLYIKDKKDNIKMIFTMCKNDCGNLVLDYNSIPSINGIEETFFSTKIEPSYEVHIDMAMDNIDYSKIEENSLIKVNGELFRVIKIDGHSVDKSDEADVVLKALV